MIPYPPTPWTAPRKKGPIFYNPKDKEKKRDIGWVKTQKIWEFYGPVRVDMTFYMPIPKSTSKKKWAVLAQEKTPHIAKPDKDNMAKYVSDVLEVAGLFKNDSQICEGYSAKFYSARPRVEIVVSSPTDTSLGDFLGSST